MNFADVNRVYGPKCLEWGLAPNKTYCCKAPFTQDAEVLANVASKKMEHVVAYWSVHTALPARSKDLRANLLTRPV